MSTKDPAGARLPRVHHESVGIGSARDRPFLARSEPIDFEPGRGMNQYGTDCLVVPDRQRDDVVLPRAPARERRVEFETPSRLSLKSP